MLSFTAQVGYHLRHRAAEDSTLLKPGARLGSYEIDSPIGAGGMGEVYKATDTNLKRSVAIKVLPAAVADDIERLARFQREAEVLAALNHPNIAAIYRLERSEGTTALVMELVEGEDLSAVIARGPVPLVDALPMARQIADALDSAHEQAIVHRDLKPANIKVRPDGAVKVLDFGLAKAIDPAGGSSVDAMKSPTVTARATEMGIIVGTAAYMSPEQARGKAVDKRADIWAFGCVLYEMLSGRRAFGGESVSDTLSAVLRDPPDWGALPPSTPMGIRHLIERCLERDPKLRLRDIGDARLELAVPSAGPDDPSHPRTPQRGRRIGRAGWIALAALAGAIAVAAWPRSVQPAADVARLTLAQTSGASLVIGDATPDLSISRDGRRIIYASRRLDPEGARVSATQLLSRRVDAFEPVALPNLGQNPHAPFFSHDGAWVVFQTSVGDQLAPVLAKAPIAGGSLTALCPLARLDDLRGASWDDEGHIVFATARRWAGLFQVSANGGTPVVLTTPDRSRGELLHVWPDVLPGGAGTLFTIMREDGNLAIAVLPRGATTWRVLVPDGSMPRYLADGHLVYIVRGVLYGTGFDLRTLTVTTPPVALVDGILTKDTGAADYSVAANGTLAYVAAEHRDALSRVVWLHRDGTTDALPLEPKPYRAAHVSPDGHRIALSILDHGVSGLWVFDTTNDGFTRVTPREESVDDFAWSPDGRRLVFWSNAQKGLFTIAADGGDRSEKLAGTDSGRFYPTAWSPDGRTIAYIQEYPTLSLFGVSTAPPHAVRPLASGVGAQVEATFSPNGKWITHIDFEGGTPEIVVGPAGDATRSWPIAPSGRHPTWTADGRGVQYLDGPSISRIAINPDSGMPVGRPVKVVDLPRTSRNRSIEMSTDGRFLILERVDEAAGPSEIRVVLNWIQTVRTKLAGEAEK
ncbi:MAG TPA: protein kinase [Vicinamibacterales bacterium]